MRAKVGARLLALASLVVLGFYLPARVYNSYDINSHYDVSAVAPTLAYQTVVAVILMTPSVLIVTLVLRRRLPLLGGTPATYIGLGAAGLLWVSVAGPMSIILGM